jgi:hypothetical protein
MLYYLPIYFIFFIFFLVSIWTPMVSILLYFHIYNYFFWYQFGHLWFQYYFTSIFIMVSILLYFHLFNLRIRIRKLYCPNSNICFNIHLSPFICIPRLLAYICLLNYVYFHHYIRIGTHTHTHAHA